MMYEAASMKKFSEIKPKENPVLSKDSYGNAIGSLCAAKRFAAPSRFDAPKGVHVGTKQPEKEIRLKGIDFVGLVRVLTHLAVAIFVNSVGSFVKAMASGSSMRAALISTLGDVEADKMAFFTNMVTHHNIWSSIQNHEFMRHGVRGGFEIQQTTSVIRHFLVLVLQKA